MFASVFPITLYPSHKKNIWKELRLNMGPLAPLATTVAAIPWLLRQVLGIILDLILLLLFLIILLVIRPGIELTSVQFSL